MYQHGEHGEAGAGRPQARHLLARALQIQPRLRALPRILYRPARLVPGPSRAGSDRLLRIRRCSRWAWGGSSAAISSRTSTPARLRLHARAPSGTRIEQTEVLFGDIEAEIRQVIPPSDLDTILDNIGLPTSGSNLAYSDNPNIGPGDGDILIALKPEHARSAGEYTDLLRKRLNARFPEATIYFEAANMTSQILNFGLPAPIDVQIMGRNAEANYALAREVERRVGRIPGAADVHIHQIVDYPEIRVNVDRSRAAQFGMTQQDVT